MKSLKKTLLGSAAVLLAVNAGYAVDVAASDDDTDVEEITVTASKRPQTLQQVPIAVSVVDADAVEKSFTNDFIDLQTIVPSLRITQLQTSSQTNFVIRGFGNGANNTGIENSVGVFIDGVYRSRSMSAILDLPILERVEILRGPQSTLFGKNVSAGAISIITKGPSDEPEGSVEATYGNYNQLYVKGTISAPIGEGLAFRVSGSMNKRDGYYTNSVTDTDINDRNRVALRGQLRWEPSENLSFRLIADYNKIDEVCCGALQIFNGPATLLIGAPVAAGGLGAAIGDDSDVFARAAVFDVNPENELVGKGVSLQADYSMEWADFTSITAYRDQTDSAFSEVDYTGADIASIPQARELQTFTQEFRLTSNGDDNKVDWMVGAFLFDEDIVTGRSVLFGADTRAYFRSVLLGATGGALDYTVFEPILGLPDGTFYADGSGIFDNYTMQNLSYSFNGQLDFNLAEGLTLTVGAAYLYDKKEAVSDVTLTEVYNTLDWDAIGQTALIPGGVATFYAENFMVDITDPTTGQAAIDAIEAVAPGTYASVLAGVTTEVNAIVGGLQAIQVFENPINYPNSDEDGILKDDAVTYSVKMAYDLTETMNVYASYSTGWKAGAYNLSSDSRPGRRTADPEDVTVMEIGLKAGFDWGNIYFAAFDQTIEGFQSNVFLGDGYFLANAGEQSVKGFEIEGNYAATENLMFTFGLTYLDPLYDEFTAAACVGEVCDLSGTKPAGIHEISTNVSATYSHQFSSGMEGFIRAEYLYESEVQVVENIPTSIASREVNLLNASMGLSLENGLDITVWGRNLTDNGFLLSAFPTVVQEGSYSGYANAPRTYGITLRYNF